MSKETQMQDIVISRNEEGGFIIRQGEHCFETQNIDAFVCHLCQRIDLQNAYLGCYQAGDVFKGVVKFRHIFDPQYRKDGSMESEMKKQPYKITVGETGNECGHVTSSSHVSDRAAIRAAKRRCAEYHGDGWWRVECAGATVARGGRVNY